jgi:glycosyltransferase involved in cell wall biosynthesis
VKIAVDARPLAPPVTGIGTYLGSLLTRLQDTGHRWFLYSDRPLAEESWKGHPQITVRHGAVAPQSLGSLAYANHHFLRWARQDRVDLFWSPRHHLPFLLPRKLPSVVTVHDLVWRRYPETLPWQNRLLERAAMARSLAQARHVIAVSEFTRDEICSFYPSVRPRCSVILEAGRELPPPESGQKPEPYFLFVGTREPRKNLPALLEAYCRLRQGGHRSHQLVIAGAAGWGDVPVAALCERLAIADSVRIEGYVTEARLAGLYAGATALVLPSVYEGFGLPVVEAMSYGTPAIVSDTAALPEVAGDAALYVNPAEPESIAAAMKRLADDSALRQSLSEAAALRSGSFSWEIAARETMAVFQASI